MEKGAVWVATSKDKRSQRKTKIEVLRSVRLLKTFTPNIGRTLIATKDILKDKKLCNLFNQTINIKYKNFNGEMGSKIQALELSPYSLTLILDNDTLPIKDLSKGFDFIGPNKRHIALSIAPRQELRDNPGVTNYQNGLMFVYKCKETLNFFERWRNGVQQQGVDSPTRFIFSHLLADDPNITLYALSYFWNFRIDLLLDFNITLGVLNKIFPQVRVLHTHLVRTRAINIFNKHPQVNEIKTIIGFQG